MVSKTIVFLCLSMAIVLLVASEAAAAGEPVETTTSQTNSAGEASVGSDQRIRCRYGCCRYYNGYCIRCCRNAEEAADVQAKAKPQN